MLHMALFNCELPGSQGEKDYMVAESESSFNLKAGQVESQECDP